MLQYIYLLVGETKFAQKFTIKINKKMYNFRDLLKLKSLN